MRIDKSKVHNILVISLSNIGDVILTMPVMDILRRDFPKAKISIVIGPKAKSLFENNPDFQGLYIFDKHQPLRKTLGWIKELRQKNFDFVVDLRNTAIPFFLWPKYRTSFSAKKDSLLHMKEKHLQRLYEVYPYEGKWERAVSLHIPFDDQMIVNKIIREEIGYGRYAVVAPGAASSDKRWTKEGFAQVADGLIKMDGVKVVFVGDEADRIVVNSIEDLMQSKAVNLCGRLSLIQLLEILKHSLFCLCNDSAPMHLSSYMNVPVLAIFGPTDPDKYGPWGKNSMYLRRNHSCLACDPHNSQTHHVCMESIKYLEVLQAIKVGKEGITFQK